MSFFDTIMGALQDNSRQQKKFFSMRKVDPIGKLNRWLMLTLTHARWHGNSDTLVQMASFGQLVAAVGAGQPAQES